ncbi:MAG: ABC transporter ATP-binding protein [Pseudomonadales bacterium]|nr:ABC transporter ATP-binding protein [Pseudomonadales bacterium]
MEDEKRGEGHMMKTDIHSTNITNLLARLWHHISQRRRRQFVLLLGLMFMSVFAELISLGAVLPFLAVLIAPDRLFSQPFVADLAHAWGITSADQLVLPLTVILVVAALMAGAVRLLLLWFSTRLAFATGVDLSLEVFRRTLYQPYRVHVTLHSSEVISGVNKASVVMFGVLLPGLLLISSLGLMVGIILTLLAIDAMVAIIAAVSFGASYGIITRLCHRQLQHDSQRIATEQIRAVKALQEGLGGIRDILLDGTQMFFSEIYRKADHALKRAQGTHSFIGGSPRFAMEAIGLALIATFAYVLSRQSEGVVAGLPVLGVFALGAQRLLPNLQQIYASWVSIVGAQASLVDLLEFLDQPLSTEAHQPEPAPLLFHDAIRFDNVRFRYSSDGPWVLDDINFSIPKGARVGFVGLTGSGKSTVLDLLMGLLEPNEGQILVDGQPISGNRLRAWQRSIAHVPQSIYLADTTLAENIAFGVPPDTIDLDRVQQAARQAQIADFIESSPEGYQAYVGERGIRLSGGQRQRIGIARALYKQASVLVFDEATSALDNATEQSVMDAIEGLSSDLTILLIAHRLTTVRRCDTIVELEHGRVVAQDTYEQLIERSP